MRVVAVLVVAAITIAATVPASSLIETPATCDQERNFQLEEYFKMLQCVKKDYEDDHTGAYSSIVGTIWRGLSYHYDHCVKRVCEKQWTRGCPGSPGKHFRSDKVSKQIRPPKDDPSIARQTPASFKPERRDAPDTRAPATKPCGTRDNPCKPPSGKSSSSSAMDRLGGGGEGGGVLRALGGGQSGGSAAAKPAAGGGASSATGGGSSAPNIGINTISKPGVTIPAQGQSPGLR